MRLVIRLLDEMPRLALVSTRRLHALEPERARALLHRLAESPIAPVRELVGAARSIVLSIYFDQDEVHEAMGYAPVPFMRSRIGLRYRLLAGAPSSQADVISPMSGTNP